MTSPSSSFGEDAFVILCRDISLHVLIYLFYMEFIFATQALERSEYWRLSDEKGKPPGVLGWWPSRVVTFIENHDTGSTQVSSITLYPNIFQPDCSGAFVPNICRPRCPILTDPILLIQYFVFQILKQTNVVPPCHR